MNQTKTIVNHLVRESRKLEYWYYQYMHDRRVYDPQDQIKVATVVSNLRGMANRLEKRIIVQQTRGEDE